MRTGFAGVAADARALWSREAALLLPIAGVFLFLPALAGGLFVPRIAPEAETTAEVLSAWVRDNIWALAGLSLLSAFGRLAILVLLLDRGRLVVGAALRQGLGLALPYLLLTIIGNLAIFGGFMLFVLPGCYLVGRLLVTGAALVTAERPDPLAALTRGMALTRHNGWMLFLLTALPVLAGQLALALVQSLAGASGQVAEHPVLAFLIAAIAAAITAATSLALALIEVAAYRRLSASSGT